MHHSLHLHLQLSETQDTLHFVYIYCLTTVGGWGMFVEFLGVQFYSSVSQTKSVRPVPPLLPHTHNWWVTLRKIPFSGQVTFQIDNDSRTSSLHGCKKTQGRVGLLQPNLRVQFNESLHWFHKVKPNEQCSKLSYHEVTVLPLQDCHTVSAGTRRGVVGDCVSHIDPYENQPGKK